MRQNDANGHVSGASPRPGGERGASPTS